MSVKSDKRIGRMALERKMIEPFEDHPVREGVISYGVSSYDYDMRVADEFRIFTNVNSTIVDPKNFDAKSFVEFKGAVCIVPHCGRSWAIPCLKSEASAQPPFALRRKCLFVMGSNGIRDAHSGTEFGLRIRVALGASL
jgi:hypothetical protein